MASTIQPNSVIENAPKLSQRDLLICLLAWRRIARFLVQDIVRSRRSVSRERTKHCLQHFRMLTSNISCVQPLRSGR